MRVIYHNSTHAPLYKRYVSYEGFVEVGVDGKYGPVDPETGAEYKALGGSDHSYNVDYKVGSSYPKCVFVYGARGHDESLTHDELESLLERHGLWSDALTPVLLPKTLEEGEPTWWEAFQFKPVERSPRIDRVTDQLKERTDLPSDVYRSGPYHVEARLEHEDRVEV